MLIVIAWFASLAGAVALHAADLFTAATATALLVVALVVALFGTRLLVLPLRRLLPDAPAASRNDFVGRICVIRTGRVGLDFGQAEVTAADGSSAIVQVRQSGADDLRAGSNALIYDLDTDGGFFWVTPLDPTAEPL